MFLLNRVDSVITDYITDDRVNGIDTDPTVFQYLSKEISLNIIKKIIVDVYKNRDADIRGLFAISDHQNFSILRVFLDLIILMREDKLLMLQIMTVFLDVLFPLKIREHTFIKLTNFLFQSYRVKLLLSSS